MKTLVRRLISNHCAKRLGRCEQLPGGGGIQTTTAKVAGRSKIGRQGKWRAEEKGQVYPPKVHGSTLTPLQQEKQAKRAKTPKHKIGTTNR